jgi:predicted RNA binding protein with dsRBD fold (UPF0201 family)
MSLPVMVVVRVSCFVCPSEDPEKVRKAILNIFPDASLEETDRGFEGTAGMDRFKELIRRQKILDSTRSMMFKGIRNGHITMHLNKQVAFVGKVSFTEPKTVLGTLRISVETDDPERLIDSIAPRTVDGEEVRT